MSLISKVVHWDMFSTPPIEPVQYYSILKKKREFSLLIQQYDAQALKHGYLHYCCIVPKNNSSSLSYKYDIFILFLNEIPNTSFIGFRLKVSKDTFVQETNLLLFFLKNSNKAVCYSMNNNCIHVKCTKSDAWELFYCLYGEYLKRYVLTVIGTRFFYSFTYLHFIQMEKQLLAMLYKGSKTVNISKKSVFYKIHRKCKISVSELIHITHNMPKNKKHVMSCFRFKEPVVLKKNKSHLFSKDNSLPDFTQHKLKQFQVTFRDVSRNTKLSQEASSSSSFVQLDSLIYSGKAHEFKQPHALPQKRKFQEIDTCDSKIISSSPSKFFKSKSDSKDHADFWEIYSDFKPYNIKSYSNIPCLKNVVPRILMDGEEREHISSDFTSCKNYSNISKQNDLLPSAFFVNKGYTTESTLSVKNMFAEIKSKNTDCSKIVVSPPTLENISIRNDLIQLCNNEASEVYNEHKSEFSALHPLICQDNISAINSLNGEFLDNTSNVVPLNNTLENWDENFSDGLNEVSFSTAAGKKINISDAAILSAHKIMKDVLNEKAQTSENEVYKHSSFKDISNSLKKINPSEKVKTRVSDELLYKKKRLEGCNISKQFETHSYNLENLNEYFGDNEDVSFTTAGGENINVSNSAMLVAQKIMENVLNEEKKPIFEGDSNLVSCKKRKYPDSSAFQGNSCTSKKLLTVDMSDVDMNGTLVEKFFEDSPFEEREIEPTECVPIKNLYVDLELNKNQNLPNYKPRKSLGGRRSMRYSDKL